MRHVLSTNKVGLRRKTNWAKSQATNIIGRGTGSCQVSLLRLQYVDLDPLNTQHYDSRSISHQQLECGVQI